MKFLSRNIILLDIDHTIRNSFWRDEMIGAQTDWDAYHKAGMKDKPYPEMVKLVHDLYIGGWRIASLTAIEEKHRQDVMRYLICSDFLIHDLIMRPTNDFTPSKILKVAQAKKAFGEKLSDHIAFIIEDRDDVCAAFRAEGVAVLQAHQRRD